MIYSYGQYHLVTRSPLMTTRNELGETNRPGGRVSCSIYPAEYNYNGITIMDVST